MPKICPAGPDDVTSADMERAYHFFIVSWMGRNGTAGSARINYQMAVRWTPGGGGGGIRFSAAVESIPWWHQRLRRVVILNADMFKVLSKISDERGVVLYVDPPYLKKTRGDGGGSVYEYDFDEVPGPDGLDDHDRLAIALRRFRLARVVVSYYDHPRLGQLYPGWTIRKIDATKNLAQQNKRGSKKCVAPEVLLINGPSFAAGGGLFG